MAEAIWVAVITLLGVPVTLFVKWLFERRKNVEDMHAAVHAAATASSLGAMEASHDAVETMATVVGELKEQVHQLRSENIELREVVAEMRSENEALVGVVAEMRTENEALRKQVEFLRLEIARFSDGSTTTQINVNIDQSGTSADDSGEPSI